MDDPFFSHELFWALGAGCSIYDLRLRLSKLAEVKSVPLECQSGRKISFTIKKAQYYHCCRLFLATCSVNGSAKGSGAPKMTGSSPHSH
jgi:hypothetical protein